MDKSIQQLFALAKAGDETARNDLYRILRVRVAELTKSRVLALDVEDLVQDVLVTFFERFEVIESEAKVLPFLFSIVSHKVGNWYQKSRTAKESERFEPNAIEAPALLVPEDPEANFRASELQECLAEALRRVRQRSSESAKIFGYLLEGKSMEQIRAAMGIATMSNLYVKINRARKLLRKILRDELKLDI